MLTRSKRDLNLLLVEVDIKNKSRKDSDQSLKISNSIRETSIYKKYLNKLLPRAGYIFQT